ncbi:hypothetical protein SAMN02910357_00823 [Succinivibrio dextrinosolvens]|uniref:hypothetical protein n=1 Tax=Succinivibrio dextrinosolvens TaxID=83771 RepID=UPI0008ED5084|nr:hypothetical protein [Succinivibrio dextrinosolvens]SFS45149.1 hypothetical protein SAMN02910357_00823 [Succinivibrio dextrinosolvens]
MKKFIVFLLVLVCVIYVGVCYVTGALIESYLANSQKYIESSNAELLKGIKLSYVSKSSGLYNREGDYVIESPVFGKSVCPTSIYSGFLHANVKMKVDELLANLARKNIVLPSSLETKTSKGQLEADVNVLSLKAVATADLSSKYQKNRYRDFSLKLVSNVDSSFNPEADLVVNNFKNPALFSCDSFNYKGNIEGLLSITSLGKGKFNGKNLGYDKYVLNKLDGEYRTYEYENGIFKLYVKAIGQGVTEHLSSFDFEGSFSSFNLDKILSPDKFRKNASEETLDIVLSDLTDAKIDKFNFSLSKNFAKRLLSENSADIPFQSNGSFKFKYAALPQSLNGVLHIGTKTLKGLGFLLKDQGNGYYGTDLVIKNGQYQLGDFALTSDFLKNTAINGLIEKLKLEDKLKVKSEKIEKELNKLDDKIKNSNIFKMIR